MEINYEPPDIAFVRPLDGRKVWIKYVTGEQGVVDLTPRLWGPVFERLSVDDQLFQQVRAEGNFIFWPDGADIAPERLWEGVMAAQQDLAPTG